MAVAGTVERDEVDAVLRGRLRPAGRHPARAGPAVMEDHRRAVRGPAERDAKVAAVLPAHRDVVGRGCHAVLSRDLPGQTGNPRSGVWAGHISWSSVVF